MNPYTLGQRKFQEWVDKRFARANTHLLTQSNLFIFPTLRGLVFVLIIFSMWVLGTNYQNNLVLATAFFLISLFVVAILRTFTNVARLELKYVSVSEAFAGDDLQVNFLVENKKNRWSDALEFSWQDSDLVATGNNYEPMQKNVDLRVSLLVKDRGVVTLPRMRVESYFPFGIIRCWTWLKWDIQAIVYPSPYKAALSNAEVSDEEGDGLHPVKGGDDFDGLKNYRSGDSLNRISWKAYAAGKGLFTKEFNQSLSKELWLDFNAVNADSAEQKLSIMCHWVLHFYFEDEPYGLILPGLKIAPEKGDRHRRRCLEALALFGATP